MIKYIVYGESYSTGKNFTLPPAVTGVTNNTSKKRIFLPPWSRLRSRKIFLQEIFSSPVERRKKISLHILPKKSEGLKDRRAGKLSPGPKRGPMPLLYFLIHLYICLSHLNCWTELVEENGLLEFKPSKEIMYASIFLLRIFSSLLS